MLCAHWGTCTVTEYARPLGERTNAVEPRLDVSSSVATSRALARRHVQGFQYSSVRRWESAKTQIFEETTVEYYQAEFAL